MAPLLAFLAAAASSAAPPAAPFVTVEELVGHPESWDGKRVRVQGLAVHEFENISLYASYEDYCHVDRRGLAAVGVEWPTLDDHPNLRRGVVLEGTFFNQYGRTRETGDGMVEIIIANASAGPGPLTDIKIVRWTSAPLTPCGRPDPEAREGSGSKTGRACRRLAGARGRSLHSE